MWFPRAFSSSYSSGKKRRGCDAGWLEVSRVFSDVPVHHCYSIKGSTFNVLKGHHCIQYARRFCVLEIQSGPSNDVMSVACDVGDPGWETWMTTSSGAWTRIAPKLSRLKCHKPGGWCRDSWLWRLKPQVRWLVEMVSSKGCGRECVPGFPLSSKGLLVNFSMP